MSDHTTHVRLHQDSMANAPLLLPVQDFWDEGTSPVVRWLSRHYEMGVAPGMSNLRGNYGLFQALGFYDHGGRTDTSAGTWRFILDRFPALREKCLMKDAFFPRQTEAWPLEHPALDQTSPFIWAGSYHPSQPKGSPLLEFDALDELTAWSMGLTDTVDEAKVRLQLDMAMQVPGFRLWIERLNILPLPMPLGCDAVKVMEQRFEIMDAPLYYPLLKRGFAKHALSHPVDMGRCPAFPLNGVPFSNGKKWPLLCPVPSDRWTITTSVRHHKGMKAYAASCPTLVPTGKATEVEVAGCFFSSLMNASLFFRLPYETVKSRLKTGKSIEAACGLHPLYHGNASYRRGTNYENHWFRMYAIMED